jgi:hypothetical protein
LFLFSCCWLPAETVSDRSKLAGTWESATPDKGDREVWVIEEDDSGLRIKHNDSGKETEFDCDRGKRDCEVKGDARKLQVSTWFNGPMLVQLETRGSDVVKRRFVVQSQDDLMEVEVMPLVPPGKTEVLRFKRVVAAASH